MFDLASLDTGAAADTGAEMKVMHPTSGAVLVQDGGKPITIILVGEDSERHRRAVRVNSDRRLKRQTSGRPVQMTAEELENDSLELVVSCTIGWSGVVLDGVEVPFSVDSARMVYKRLRWLREQVDAFIYDRSNFLKASPNI